VPELGDVLDELGALPPQPLVLLAQLHALGHGSLRLGTLPAGRGAGHSGSQGDLGRQRWRSSLFCSGALSDLSTWGCLSRLGSRNYEGNLGSHLRGGLGSLGRPRRPHEPGGPDRSAGLRRGQNEEQRQQRRAGAAAIPLRVHWTRICMLSEAR